VVCALLLTVAMGVKRLPRAVVVAVFAMFAKAGCSSPGPFQVGDASPNDGEIGIGDSGTGGAGSGGKGASGGSGGASVDGVGDRSPGSGGAADAGDAASSDSRGGTPFAAVQAIIQMNCVRCHDPAHPVVPETQTFVAMDLTAPHAYADLVNKRATETCGGILVVPGSPATSYLYAKVSQDMPCDGQRMPHQGMIRTLPLPADEIATIESWIQGGALP
jgi:hypothetical protein